MKKSFIIVGFVLACCLSAFSDNIWIKASAGQAAISGSDYNRGVQGSNDLNPILYSNVNGIFSALDRGLDLALEFGHSFNSRVSVGLSFGYLQVREEDTVEYDSSYWTSTYHEQMTVKPDFHAFPIIANFHYSLPVWKIRINLTAGAGLYLCRFNFAQDYRTTQFDWNYAYTLVDNAAVPAVQGGLGIEVPLSGRLSVVLDVIGRYARVNEISGDWAASGYLDGRPYSVSGENHTFWCYDFESGKMFYPQTSFQEYEPTSSSIKNAHKGRFDFSGFVATLGFKIGL